MEFPEGSITQTAFVVRNIEQSAQRWTALTGAGPWFVMQPETKNTLYRGQPSSSGYRLAMAFVGSSLIELIQPTDDGPSIFTEVLDQRGEGFHHLGPRVRALKGATFDERCRELEQQGLTAAMTNEVVGLGRAAFYDATDTIGGFIEVFEIGEGYAGLPLMAEIHAGWDGSDPFRSFDSLAAPA